MGEKLDHTLVNPNQMLHYSTDMKDNPWMYKLMGLTCPKKYVTITLYMSSTIICAETSSPTQQQLEDFTWIILTSQHEWDPNSVRFPKGSHSEKEEYLFTGIVDICVDALRRNVHETEIDPGLRNTVKIRPLLWRD